MATRQDRVPRMPRGTRARPAVGRREAGSLSLEAAMALPLVALLAFAFLQLVGVSRDALLAQDLARVGARVAATSTSDRDVEQAIRAAAGRDLETEIRVTPATRRHGSTITVEVVVRRPARPFPYAVRGRAVAHGEPLLGGGS